MGVLFFSDNKNYYQYQLKYSIIRLRHSYVTCLLNSGAPLKVAQENPGHSDIGTTMHYRHIAQEDRHAATRSLSLSMKRRSAKKE